TEHSAIVSNLAVGTVLSVLDVERTQSETWAKVSIPGESKPAYVKVPPDVSNGEMDIGKPLLEIFVAGRSGGVASLVDQAPILEEVKKLVSNKSTIEWVSIATPKTNSSRDSAIYGLRAVYLTDVLAQSGLPRERISTVEDVADVSGVDLRVRFYGN